MGKALKQIFVIFLFLCISNGIFAEETIRLTNGEWLPYLSETLKHHGVASRIVTEAFALEGIKVEYVFLPWKRAYENARYGEYDGSVVWSRSPEREKDFYYSDVIIDGISVFFHLKSYPFDWKTIQDLKGIQVGGTLGYHYALLEEAEKSGLIKIERAKTDKHNFLKLLYGHIEIFQLDRELGYYLLNKSFKPEEVVLFTHHPKPIVRDTYHLILSKKNEKNKRMLVLFNRGLKRLRESGKVDQYIAESLRGEYIK